MTDTIRQRVRDEIIDQLNAAATSDLPQATKRRWLPGMPIEGPRIAVFFGEEETRNPLGRKAPVHRKELTVAVQCLQVCNDPVEIDDAVEPLLLHVSDSLSDLSDNLRALVSDLDPLSVKWETAQGDKIYVCATAVYTATYQIKRTNAAATQ